MLERVKRLFSSRRRQAELLAHLDRLRQRLPVPVFWLFGKTQSGKTSVVKFLTGAEDAEIGHGFQPCTRFSRRYQFPTPEAPLMTFLDTRGLDEPDYDPTEDITQFNELAHVVVVTVRALDHAQENVLRHLREIRRAQPRRPMLLVLTCLHEGYPQQQHPLPFPFPADLAKTPLPDNENGLAQLDRSIAEQRRRFDGLVDRIVPVDLTRPEEGFDVANYGGEQLKTALLELLPEAYAHTLRTLAEATNELRDLYARHALPHILAYSTLAATTGAIPVPWIDLLILPGIQTRMVHHLARYYGQPLTAQRFIEIASTLGMGMLVRQASREVMKFIPYVGSVAGGVLAGASTFALGKAFCFYYSAVHAGHVPRPDELRQYYQQELKAAERSWGAL
jgi:uncharacterized protein (DUF697 family)